MFVPKGAQKQERKDQHRQRYSLECLGAIASFLQIPHVAGFYVAPVDAAATPGDSESGRRWGPVSAFAEVAVGVLLRRGSVVW